MRRDAPVSSEAGERRGCDGRPRLDPPDHRRIIDAGGRYNRRPWASVSESDGGTRLSFPSTDPGREVFQPRVVVCLSHGRASLPARRLRGPCPADRWSSRAPISSVFIPAVPPKLFHVNTVMCMTIRIAFVVYLSSLTGMRRLAIAPSEWLGGPSRPPPPPRGRRHLWQAVLTRPRRDRSGAAASLPPLFQQRGQQRQPPPQALSAQPPRPRPTAYWP